MNIVQKIAIGALVSLVIASTLVFVVYQKLQSTKAVELRNSQVRHYVAATRNIAAGESLTPDMLTSVNWTSSLPVDGAIDSPDKAVGHIAAYALAGGMVLTDKSLAEPNSAVGLPQKIPEGMRAIAIQTDEVADFAGFLFPGSHVDVLMTNKTGTSSGTGPNAHADRDRTILVLEDVGVLATGKQMVPDPTGKPTAVSVVTLLVTPDDSRKVALAQQKGVVHLALRNGGDHGTADHKTTYLSDLTGVMPDVEIRPAHAKKAEKKRAEESSLQHLEVVRGTKTSTQTYRNNVQVEESMAAQPVGGISK